MSKQINLEANIQVFADIDGLTVMIALTDDTGYNGIYFVQN